MQEQLLLIESIAKDKSIDIVRPVSDDFIVPFDKNHLALILRNLFQNALRFTNNGGTYILKVGAEQAKFIKK